MGDRQLLGSPTNVYGAGAGHWKHGGVAIGCGTLGTQGLEHLVTLITVASFLLTSVRTEPPPP